MKTLMKGVLIAVAICAVAVTQARAATVENITFKDTDIRTVLQGIAKMASSDNADINIVVAPNVTGQVTIDLVRVNWETALKVICQSYNLKSKREKNVIMVTALPVGADGTVVRSDEYEIKVFNLKFLDANDAMHAVKPILSGSGQASVLETTGQSGWEFGTATTTKYKTSSDKLKRTKVLVVSDSSSKIEQVTNLLDQLDIMPKQILIKTRIMEVNHDLLRDIGLDWGTGDDGAESETLNAQKLVAGDYDFATHGLALKTPSSFGALTTGLSTSNSGLQLMFKHLNGTEFEVILHALDENAKANTLSAPIIMTLNNQEATILIGTKYPIIKTDVSTETNAIIGGSLQEYKDIGIQLNVVPQIWGEKEGFINLIIHPAVSSYSTTAKVLGGAAGTTTLVEYPIISTREAETQLVVRDGGTVMLGGLIKDVKVDHVIGIPFLSKIPILGLLFKRTVTDTQKIELVIFITAKIMNPGDEVPQEVINAGAIQAQFEQ